MISDPCLHKGFVMGLFDQIGVDSSIYMLAYQVGLHLRGCWWILFLSFTRFACADSSALDARAVGFWGLTGLC